MTEAKANQNQKNEPKTESKTETKTNTGYAQSKYTYPHTKKISWHRGVVKWLQKIAGVIRSIIHLIGEIFQHVMDLITYFFSIAVKLSISPTSPITFAIIAFLIVAAVTLNQWWCIGIWVAKIAHTNRYIAGVVGVLFGIGINTFQLSPRLWKISRAMTEAYKAMEVNTEYEPDDEETPQSLERNWLSANHRSLKTISAISYCLESAIVIGYVGISEKLAMFALFQMVVSLILPEQVLRFASHTISIMGAASRRVAYQEPPESEVNL